MILLEKQLLRSPPPELPPYEGHLPQRLARHLSVPADIDKQVTQFDCRAYVSETVLSSTRLPTIYSDEEEPPLLSRFRQICKSIPT